MILTELGQCLNMGLPWFNLSLNFIFSERNYIIMELDPRALELLIWKIK